MRLLLVEDEPTLRAQLRSGLMGAGYAVDEAHAVRVQSSNVRGFSALPMTVTLR